MAGGRRGAGFFSGVLAGLALSGATLAALSLSAPAGAPQRAPVAEPAAEPARAPDPAPAAAPAAAPVVAPPPPAAADLAPPPPAAPPAPAWRRNAATRDAAGEGPAVVVALLGVEAQPALADRALASGAATLVIAPAAPGALTLGVRARALGLEVFLLGAGVTPWAAGRAARGLAADARAAAAAAGLAALDLDPAGPNPQGAALRADFALDPAASAERVFQTLDEAARRAGPDGVSVVALSVTDAALTGLARWRAVATARLIPATAAIED